MWDVEITQFVLQILKARPAAMLQGVAHVRITEFEFLIQVCPLRLTLVTMTQKEACLLEWHFLPIPKSVTVSGQVCNRNQFQYLTDYLYYDSRVDFPGSKSEIPNIKIAPLPLSSGRLVFAEEIVLIGRMTSKLAITSHFIILLRVHIIFLLKIYIKCCCF